MSTIAAQPVQDEATLANSSDDDNSSEQQSSEAWAKNIFDTEAADYDGRHYRNIKWSWPLLIQSHFDCNDVRRHSYHDYWCSRVSFDELIADRRKNYISTWILLDFENQVLKLGPQIATFALDVDRFFDNWQKGGVRVDPLWSFLLQRLAEVDTNVRFCYHAAEGQGIATEQDARLLEGIGAFRKCIDRITPVHSRILALSRINHSIRLPAAGSELQLSQLPLPST